MQSIVVPSPISPHTAHQRKLHKKGGCMRRREMGRRDERTHATEFASAVAALGCGGELFNVVVAEDTAGRLDDAAAVGGGVVRLTLAERDALSHWSSWL